MSNPAQALVSIQHISKSFELDRNRRVKALSDFSLEIYPGETVGLVGESGCGKSTAGRVILGLYQASSGQVFINGCNVHQAKGAQKKALIRQAQMIFQDPYASLNPRSTVFDIIAEPLEIHAIYTKHEDLKARVYELLAEVGLRPEHANRYPHEFSGGQRQRIGIARALALEPKFIVADEPISALDVSIQAQIVLLLQKLQAEKGLTYLFIAHDLSMVKYISDRIGVMYLGHLVELAPSHTLYEQPMHPYTQALLSAIPIADPNVEDSRQRIILEGEVPSAINPPSGCVFHTRCRHRQAQCVSQKPPLQEWQPGHYVACHLVPAQSTGTSSSTTQSKDNSIQQSTKPYPQDTGQAMQGSAIASTSAMQVTKQATPSTSAMQLTKQATPSTSAIQEAKQAAPYTLSIQGASQ